MAIRKSKINIDTEERSDFDNMLNDVENEVEVQIPEDNNIATTENVAHVAMLFSSINVRKPN